MTVNREDSRIQRQVGLLNAMAEYNGQIAIMLVVTHDTGMLKDYRLTL